MKNSTEPPFLWLFALLAVVGLAADLASKYLVFSKLYPDAQAVQTVEFEVVAGCFSLQTHYSQKSDPGDSLSFLRTISGDRLPHVNRGALFGWGNGNGDPESGGMNSVFAGISILAAAFILIWAFRPLVAQDRFLSLALGMILGGTLGNLYDRIVFGGVRDFLHCYYVDSNGLPHIWPDFNIADCCLVCGAGVLLVHSFFVTDKTAEPAAETPAVMQATSPTNGV